MTTCHIKGHISFTVLLLITHAEMQQHSDGLVKYTIRQAFVSDQMTLLTEQSLHSYASQMWTQQSIVACSQPAYVFDNTWYRVKEGMLLPVATSKLAS